MANAGATKYQFKKESAYSTHPGGTFFRFPATSDDLEQQNEEESSQQLALGRHVAEFIRLGESVVGSIPFELEYSVLDEVFQAVMNDGAGWGSEVTLEETGSGLTITASSGAVAATAGSPFTNVDAGAIVRLQGWSDSANDGKVVRVATKTDSQNITIEPNDTTNGAGTLADEGPNTAGKLIIGAKLDHGEFTEIDSGTAADDFIAFTIEKIISKVSAANGGVRNFLGMVPNTLTLDFPSKARVTGSVSFIGTHDNPNTGGASSLDSGDPWGTKQIFNTSKHQKWRIIDGKYDKLSQFSITIDNGLRIRPDLGDFRPANFNTNDFLVTGRLLQYFVDDQIMQIYIDTNGTGPTQKICFVIEDTPLGSDVYGNAYAFNMPKVHYTAGHHKAGGKDQDLFADMTYRALIDESLPNPITGQTGQSLRIYRWASST